MNKARIYISARVKSTLGFLSVETKHLHRGDERTTLWVNDTPTRPIKTVNLPSFLKRVYSPGSFGETYDYRGGKKAAGESSSSFPAGSSLVLVLKVEHARNLLSRPVEVELAG